MLKISNPETLVSACVAGIEAKLGWGDSQAWTKTDFEKLSGIIKDKTGVTLSVTTLKRIWGKVKYENKPTVTTLNTLAQFLDFESWRVFVQHESQKNARRNANIIPDRKIPEPEPEKRRSSAKSYPVSWLIVVIIAFAVFLTLFSSYKLNHNPAKPAGIAIDYPVPDASKFSFSVNKIVTEGVPNSVVFTYDATAASSDSVFIVQTWDINRKTLVAKNDRSHSAIYYYPGFFRTKLIADGRVVKTHDLQINTDGWLALADGDSLPVYFKKEDYAKDTVVNIDEAVLKRYNLSLFPRSPKIRFFNQGDFGNLMNDNFEFETTLKNEFSIADNACQYVEVLIQCKDDIIIIPLSSKACVGQLHLYAAGADVSSKFADLSKFGCNMNNWTNLKVVCRNKQMDFSINGIKAYSLTFPHTPTEIVGVQYRFNGIGAIRNTYFKNKDGKIKL